MQYIPAKTIVSGYYEGGWFASNYTMNIYKGCCHGCIYCDSRSECYRVENFDTVRAKENALHTIAQDLKSKRKKGVVITGSMSDAYNPLERAHRLTEGALHLLDSHGFGIAIDTKSDLVTRDIALLQSIQRHSPAAVSFTITCIDDDLCKKVERSVCLTSERLAAIRQLAEAGIPCGVLLMPILPFINDTQANIIGIVDAAHRAGAKWIFPYEGFGVTLRQNQRVYFYDRLDESFPGLRERYVTAYGDAYECISPNTAALWQAFTKACKERGLLYRMPEISEWLMRPYQTEQISLF